jgi:hypothetical protein
MGIKDRLSRLEGGRECEECPYLAPTRTLETLRVLYPDGTEDRRRDPRATERGPAETEVCHQCPHARRGVPPIRVVEVVRTIRA